MINNEIIAVAGQMFIEHGKELDNSNRNSKGYEDYIGDNKNKNDILDKVCGENVKDVCSDKPEVCRNNSINRFIKISNNIKRDVQSKDYFSLKKI